MKTNAERSVRIFEALWNVRFEGFQVGPSGSHLSFTENETGSSFLLGNLSEIGSKIKEVRDRFKRVT